MRLAGTREWRGGVRWVVFPLLTAACALGGVWVWSGVPQAESSDGIAAISGPVAHWPLDDGQGASLRDASGNEHAAELAGDAPPRWSRDVAATPAVRFDGTGGFAWAAGEGTLAGLTEQLTIQAWVKTYPAANGTILDTVVGEDRSGSFGLYLTGGYAVFELTVNGTTVSATSATAISDAQWHLLTASFDGEQMRVYRDGRLDGLARVTGPIDPTEYVVVLGRSASGWPLVGWLRDVRVYDRALTPAETAQLYGAGREELGIGAPSDSGDTVAGLNTTDGSRVWGFESFGGSGGFELSRSKLWELD